MDKQNSSPTYYTFEDSSGYLRRMTPEQFVRWKQAGSPPLGEPLTDEAETGDSRDSQTTG